MAYDTKSLQKSIELKILLHSVVPIVIPCAIDGGLSETTFLIDF
jgi:hypothetical protein